MVVNENERDMSEFNMAISYLNRLNNLFYGADNAAINLDAYAWFNLLNALFREMSTEMKHDEVEKWNVNMIRINSLIENNLKNMSKTGQIKISTTLYFELHNYELFLRKICKESGLQQKMKEDPTKALM